MPQSTRQAIKKIAGTPTPEQWDGEIVTIDYVMRELGVRMAGGAVLAVRANRDMDFGTADNPRIKISDRVRVVRVGDQLIASMVVERFFLPYIGHSSTAQTLAAPEWLAGYPRIAGANLEGRYTQVPGAVAYEVWYNSVPSLNGAEHFGTFQTTQFARALNLGQVSQRVQNGTFETGDLSAWSSEGAGGYTGGHPNVQVTTSVKHSGSYALMIDTATSGIPGGVASEQFSVAAATSYAITVWRNTTAWTLGTHRFYIQWLDSDGDQISIDYLVTVTGTSAGWVVTQISKTAPANSVHARLGFEIGNGFQTTYFDDITVFGYEQNNAPLDFFSVRAVDANGNASPFSSWLVPIQTSSALGDAAGDHLQLSPTGQIISSISGSPPIVAMSPKGLTTTGWEVPLDLANPPAWQAWTRASDTTFTVPDDVSGMYTTDTRLRWVQNSTTKYGRVTTDATYSGGTGLTTVTITGDTITSGQAISDQYYSYHYRPQAYPATLMPSGNIFLPFTGARLLQPFSSTNSYIGFCALSKTVTFVSFYCNVFVATTNDSSNYWTIKIQDVSGGTTYATLSTASGVSASTHTLISTTTFSPATAGTSDKGLQLICEKVGSPGDLYVYPLVTVS